MVASIYPVILLVDRTSVCSRIYFHVNETRVESLPAYIEVPAESPLGETVDGDKAYSPRFCTLLRMQVGSTQCFTGPSGFKR